jgi:predicted nucleotidyltransferase
MVTTAIDVAPLPGATSHIGYDASSAQVRHTLRDVVAALDGARLPYVTIGGIASSVHGRGRCTGDIDLFVKPDDARPVLRALAAAGFDTDELNPQWLFKATRAGVLVDVLFKAHGDIYVDDEMLARAETRPFHGVDVRVAPPEDMVVIKALAHDEETPRHWHDALAIVAARPLDWTYLVHRARKGPRRVLSLLLYALSNDLLVPADPIRQLHALLFDETARTDKAP